MELIKQQNDMIKCKDNNKEVSIQTNLKLEIDRGIVAIKKFK